MKKILEHLNENIISLLYTIIGSEIILYSAYRKFTLIGSIFVAIIVILTYILFKKVVELDKKGPLLYLPVATIIFIIAGVFIAIGSVSTSCGFYTWFIGGGSYTVNSVPYLLATIVLVPFIFSSLSYYFSVTVIRMPMMFLISFIAFTINIKGVYKANNLFVLAFIVILFLLFVVGTKKKNLNSESIYNVRSLHMLSLGGTIVLIAFIIGFLIPKGNWIPDIEVLDGIKDNVLSYMKGTEGLGTGEGESNGGSSGSNGEDNSSKINGSSPPIQDTIHFTFKGENPEYLVTKNYDTYKENEWVQENQDKKMGLDITEGDNQGIQSFTESVLDNLEVMNDDLDAIKTKFNDQYIRKSMVITVNDFKTNKLAHPSKAFRGTLSDNKIKSLYLNEFDEVYQRGSEEFSKYQQYSVDYMSDEPAYGSRQEAMIKYFSDERYTELSTYFSSDPRTAKGFLEINESYHSNYNRLGDNISNDIYNLSKSLTRGKLSYYDKAKSIEEHFTSGEYVYNLNLPETEVKGEYMDYFIFEGKQGYCKQYATAMTILCRASGIPARYVEGYLVTEKDLVGSEYVVKASNGHAFVEVFIPGYGWKIFDPTPPTADVDKEVPVTKTIGIKTIIIIAIIIVVIIIGIISTIMILKATKRPRFLKKTKQLPNNEAFRVLVKDCVKLLERCYLTPYSGETALKFAKRVDSSIQIGFKELMEIYYKHQYSEEDITDIDVEKAFVVNESIYNFTKS
ncbi:MAG: transglutaminase domain-containing protein [Clostridium sp.]